MKENSFSHSVKVPRLYKIAAKIAEEVKTKGASVKDLVYQKKHPNIKALYALIVETLQHETNLDYLIKESELSKEARLDSWLARILITELLWGKKRLAGQSKPVQTILNYQQKLLELSKTLDDPKKGKSIRKATFPRYVRVNTLVMSVAEAIDGFRDEGWTFFRHNCNSYEKYLENIKNLQSDHFTIDFHIKDVLVFPPGTQFYDHPCYQNGSIILQDKASCIPVALLNPTPKSTILDMCAAPGMKAGQLAAYINNDGTIYAVEKDQRRFETLNKLIELTGATCVKSVNRDVLTMTDQEFANVDYILVDPSCSGSGMLNRLDCTDPQEVCDAARLEKLSCFQIVLLKHALKKFPTAKRVVYSTCSIYPEENELVVEAVLRSCPNFQLVDAKELLNGQWINFGSDQYKDIGRKCLYSKPELDMTNGFFVAVFERIESQKKRKLKTDEEVETQIKPKKKKREKEIGEVEVVDQSEVKKSKKKKKTHKRDLDSETNLVEDFPENNPEQKEVSNNCEKNVELGHKKKKKKKDVEIETSPTVNFLENNESKEFNNDSEKNIELGHKKKKKKMKEVEIETSPTVNFMENNELKEFINDSEKNVELRHKKKKKNKKEKDKNISLISENNEIENNMENNIEKLHKKKKKKKSKEIES